MELHENRELAETQGWAETANTVFLVLDPLTGVCHKEIGAGSFYTIYQQVSVNQ